MSIVNPKFLLRGRLEFKCHWSEGEYDIHGFR